MNKKLANYTKTNLEQSIITLLIRINRLISNAKNRSTKSLNITTYKNAKKALFEILSKIRKHESLTEQQHNLINALEQDHTLPPALYQHVKTQDTYYIFGPLTKQIDISKPATSTRFKRYSLVAEYDLSSVNQQQTKKAF